MSNYNYLQQIQKLLPTIQGRHILNYLIEKKESGEIRTLDEFKSQLKTLTDNLLNNKIVPTFTARKAIAKQDISSESYNKMLKEIANDLETCFTEANNLDEIISAHHNLIKDVSFKTIKLAIAKLESQIALYEFINSTNIGVDDSQFNTFRETDIITTSRNDKNGNIVFKDLLNNNIVSEEETAYIDQVGERLSLGLQVEKYIDISGVKLLANANSVRSEIDANFTNSNINNLIDNQTNTFWALPILLSNIKTDGVTIELQLDLPATQEVNFIELFPIGKFPVTLLNLYYLDSTNTRQTLINNEQTLNQQTRINFNKIFTKSFVVVLKQESFVETQFEQIEKTPLFRRIITNQFNTIIKSNLSDIKNDLKTIITSEFLKDLFVISNEINELSKYYEYTFALDNIKVGYASYYDRSIYVPQSKTINQPTLIGLTVEEIRPYIDLTTNEQGFIEDIYPIESSNINKKYYKGSIEYNLHIFSYDNSGYQFAIDSIPILPHEANRIYHEKLIFTEKTDDLYINNNAGILRFYTNNDASTIYMYKNGILLTCGTDWEIYNTLSVTNPNTGKPMKRGVKLLTDPSPLDIYTISYNPIQSNTMLRISNNANFLQNVDLVGDNTIRLAKDNLIIFDDFRKGYKLDKIEVYLQIMLRNNSNDNFVSPYLEEYLLVFNSKNDEKFSKEY